MKHVYVRGKHSGNIWSMFTNETLAIGDMVQPSNEGGLLSKANVDSHKIIGVVVQAEPEPYIDELRKMARQRMKELAK